MLSWLTNHIYLALLLKSAFYAISCAAARVSHAKLWVKGSVLYRSVPGSPPRNYKSSHVEDALFFFSFSLSLPIVLKSAFSPFFFSLTLSLVCLQSQRAYRHIFYSNSAKCSRRSCVQKSRKIENKTTKRKYGAKCMNTWINLSHARVFYVPECDLCDLCSMFQNVISALQKALYPVTLSHKWCQSQRISCDHIWPQSYVFCVFV